MSDPTPTPYPVILEGHPDGTLGRFRWLVKWFLVDMGPDDPGAVSPPQPVADPLAV